jgi:hypothetical protein
MKMKLNNIYLLALLLAASFSFAQKDSLAPLHSNVVLTTHKNQINADNNLRLMVTTSGDTVELPFRDDFVYPGPYPDSTRWMKSKSVYVNRTYARNPRTLGVATFDGLKSTGYPYKPLGSSSLENCDTLTSKYIRLDSLTLLHHQIVPGDSVYLSFYYEHRGYGLWPGSTHTLVLDFFNPTTQTWSTKMTLTRSGNTNSWQVKDSTFTLVMIPITDPQLFKKNFRFRFRNKSNGTGAVSHWHIDNILLDVGRFKTDTTLHDLSYVLPGQTLLENYTAMPYEQYTGASLMANHSYLKIRNNDNASLNFTNFMEIRDNNNSVVLYDTTGADNALPFYPNGYVSNPDIADPLNSTLSPSINNFSFNNGNPLTDSITYRVKHYFISGPVDADKLNDTLVHKQVFHNYYAYDDGTAELGYYLTQYGAKTAVQYTLNNADVLRAIDIFFDPVPINSTSVYSLSQLLFGLRVWGNGGGTPGSVLYDDNNSMNRNPNYYQWGPVNYFKRYYLHYPLTMSPGVFYVGIQQDDVTGLNVGFDQNTNTQLKNFYDVGNGWVTNTFPGSLMIRPVFGDSAWAAAGIHQEVSKATNILVYPNPASDKLFIKTAERLSNMEVELIDALGKTQIRQNVVDGEAVSVADLLPGFYFARVYSEGQLLKVQKIIISR